MINLAGPVAKSPKSDLTQPRLLDPFCGTGVLLQEAMLLGFDVYGTDLSEKMIRYSRDNLNWIQDTARMTSPWYLHEGDAMNTQWRQPIDAVACETYLGQPFSAPPSAEKLAQLYRDADMAARDGLRLAGTDAEERGLTEAGDAVVIAAMAEDPKLIERPLVETDKGVRLCRPPEKVREIL